MIDSKFKFWFTSLEHFTSSWSNLFLLALKHRIDFILREGSMESSYLSALTSHTSYWGNMDVAFFLLTTFCPQLLEKTSWRSSIISLIYGNKGTLKKIFFFLSRVVRVRWLLTQSLFFLVIYLVDKFLVQKIVI